MYQGSGLGNQLFRYITARTLAKEKKVPFGIAQPENFKGSSFLHLDMGEGVPLDPIYTSFVEKKVLENGVDIRGYDPEINFVEDNTIIDGEFQDERYWRHNLGEINEWLEVAPYEVEENICIIGFRGGEYAHFPDLFLPQEYWDAAIQQMRIIRPDMQFEVHTDDPVTARAFFPHYRIIENTQLSHSNHTNMGLNWRAMRYAEYAIIANSSFYILPRILAEGVTIAPRFWARRNTRTWALPSNYYKGFVYL